jgi:hypothetical protein
MKRRVLWWAVAGVSIAIGWTAYFFATPRTYKIALASDYEISLADQLLQAIQVVTYPALLAGATFRWVMIPLNGVIYAIVGFAVGLVQGRPDR